MKRPFFIFILFLFIASNGQEVKDQKENKVLKNIPDGYDTLSWGTMLTNAKDKIRGKLYFTDDKTLIISREGNLEYNYGFFYIDPGLEKAEGKEGEVREADKTAAGKKEASMKADEGKLFYVALKFPYLTMEEVRKKIEDKHGSYTNEDMNKFQGAIAWNGEKTIIIMWVDRYEDKPYCGRITYVSKEITKELNEYHLRVFNRVEREIIRKLTP
ncbi:MAG: hypothetical protein A2W19_10725 [Spirochaetes bacterium RBG_16_49_21]|nr:MAG: hypothetical protein A2W19_10725 [Spirochaetes bacterium RBG_16_49_21]